MPRKKILIDGYNLGLETGTGIATYARNLSHAAHDLGWEVDALYGTRAAPHHPLLREIAFFDARVGRPPRWLVLARKGKDLAKAPFGVRPRAVPITGQVIATSFQARLPYFDQLWNAPNLFNRAATFYDAFKLRLRVAMDQPPAIAHWTYPLPLKISGAKNIYTLHDLVPLRLPYTTLDIKRRYFRLVRMLAHRADHIVTVSENSKKDIVNLLGVAPERVTNTYQSVDIPEKYAAKPDDIVRREVEGTFNLGYKNYLLFFGAIEPKKNVGRLIEAYLASQSETPLVIVGKLAWETGHELQMLNDNVVRYLEQVDKFTFTRSRIMRIEYAPFPLLVSLIKGAKAVLFPSLYEGFGLPALEAMQLGAPLLTSTEGSMPEVAGDAALAVDPYDTRAITDGIIALDKNADLRGKLAAKGRQQAALFSAEKYRKRLTELYDRVLSPE